MIFIFGYNHFHYFILENLMKFIFVNMNFSVIPKLYLESSYFSKLLWTDRHLYHIIGWIDWEEKRIICKYLLSFEKNNVFYISYKLSISSFTPEINFKYFFIWKKVVFILETIILLLNLCLLFLWTTLRWFYLHSEIMLVSVFIDFKRQPLAKFFHNYISERIKFQNIGKVIIGSFL